MRELILTRTEMLTLEMILEKYVRILNNMDVQKNFTIPEIIEIRNIYRRVLCQNQKPERKEVVNGKEKVS